MERCALRGAVVQNVTIDGLTSITAPVICFANEFRCVTLKGHIRSLILNMRHSIPEYDQQYLTHLRECDGSDVFSLDISEAIGDIEIRGYSARRIIRNSELLAVVRWENTVVGRWELVDLAGTLFSVPIGEMLHYGWPDIILVANPRGHEFDHELRAIQRLREAGIAEEV